MSTTSDQDISYEIVRSHRATADIVIERDGRVLIRAPESVPDERIEDLVEAKRYWIYKNLAEWRDLNATRVLREYFQERPGEFDLRPPGKIFMAEYAKFIVSRNEFLGSAGNQASARAHAMKQK